MKRNPPNLHDVAKLAGVSIATVSRTLNGGAVSPLTRRAVERAIGQLSYVTHGAARALSSRRTYTVGAVIPDLDNAIFASTTNALQRVLDPLGYMLIVACHSYSLDEEYKLVKRLLGHGIDGLVLVGTEHRPETFGLINEYQLPYVLTWTSDPSERYPVVGFDHRKAMVPITKHLLDLGHIKFAVISGITRENGLVRARLLGVRETLEGAGIVLDKDLIVEGPFTYATGVSAMEHFLRSPSPPTAIVCLNDVLAIGAISACKAAGLNVPADISVTGCVDLDVASIYSPGLTTVRFPTAEVGKETGVQLLNAIGGASQRAHFEFQTELIVRETTAIPKRGQVIPKAAP